MMDVRQILFRYRSYTPVPFILCMLFFAHPTVASMIAGLGLVGLGELMRLWGVSYAGSETRTTGTVGASALITSGPFAYIRNPLYLGNMLMYFGFGIMANVPVLALIGLIYFFFQYTLIVSLEEENLFKMFPVEYVKYFHSVPRFFPDFKRYTEGSAEQQKVNWNKGMKSERRTFQAIAVITTLILLLWILQELNILCG